ncbi:MAG: NAD(P)/FAD-dependent oxidoreductase [Solirubrobacterales bacterium]|nr:NAD(P)/FAD-dependent oxidoreductase [Solirubrobacterales bacterium]
MCSSPLEKFDVVVIGAGPAGVVAALRAARLGAKIGLVTRDEFGGMAANDGPVPVRTLAHAARLMREARQLPRYGIDAGSPMLDYKRLLHRVREVTDDARANSMLRKDLADAGVTVHEQAGSARFAEPHVIVSERGPQMHADTVIICTGGVSRRLPIPGFELTCTHSDAWELGAVPRSMLVIGAGATGVQVASIFNAFGSSVVLFEAAPRILMTEDPDVAAEMAAALEASGIEVVEDAGRIERFEGSENGVRMVYFGQGAIQHREAELAVVAVGWQANTAGLELAVAGVETDSRGFVRVDSRLQTSAPHVFAAGDVTGRLMVVHEAVREAFLAASYAVTGSGPDTLPPEVSPVGSFTDPEYASVGITEEAARKRWDVVVGVQRFDALPRSIIDGRTSGFCKVVVDRDRHAVLGCHVVGERAVELAQLGAVAMAAGMSVEQLATVPFSVPTYANALARAAVRAAQQLPARAAGPAEDTPAERADLTSVAG